MSVNIVYLGLRSFRLYNSQLSQLWIGRRPDSSFLIIPTDIPLERLQVIFLLVSLLKLSIFMFHDTLGMFHVKKIMFSKILVIIKKDEEDVLLDEVNKPYDSIKYFLNITLNLTFHSRIINYHIKTASMVSKVNGLGISETLEKCRRSRITRHQTND